MLSRRRLSLFMTIAAIGLPLAACGDDEVGSLRDDLREAEEAARSGSEDAKREARELERKIEREVNERK